MVDQPRRSRRQRLVNRLSGLVRRAPSASPPAPPRAPAPPPRAPLAVPAAPPPAAPERRADGIGGLWFALERRMDAIANAITGFGTGDKVTTSRPDTRIQPLRYAELSSELRHGGYSKRFVEVLPKDATRKGWVIKADKEIVDTKDEEKRLRLRKRVKEADTWGRWYGDAFLWMVVTEEPNELGQQPPLSQPLDLSRIRTLDNLVVIEKIEATVMEYESDPRNPNYRKPSLYWVTTTVGGMASRGNNTEIVHASRLVGFAGSELPPQLFLANGGYNDSVIQSVWDAIRNRTSMDHGVAAIVQEMRVTALKMEELAGIGVDAEEEYHQTRMRMLAMEKSLLNMVLLGKGEEYQQHSGTVAGMGEASGILDKSLNAQTAMPDQLWNGTAPGGLSTDGESHRNLWANNISSYQDDKYTPPLTTIYEVMFAAKLGPWGGTAPEGWMIEYRPLDELTAAGKADLRAKATLADAAAIQSGVLDPQHVARGRYGKQGSFEELPPIDEASFERGPELDIGALLAGIPGLGGETAPGPVDPNAPAPVTDDPAAGQMEDRRRLAAHMTELGVRACEHGRTSKCDRCGVERRAREVLTNEDGTPQLGDDGKPVWGIRWAALDDYDTDGDADADGERTISILDAVSRMVNGRNLPGRGPLPAQLRADADDGVSVWVGLPLPRDAVSTWESQRLTASTTLGLELGDLDTRGKPPHVTALFVGRFPTTAEAQLAADKAREVLDTALRVGDDGQPEHGTLALDAWGIGAFPPSAGSGGDTPVIMQIGGDALRALHETLSRELLDEEERKERPWYQAHATLGYYDGELTPQQRCDLWTIQVPRETWQADTVLLNVGGETVATWTLRARE